ncbi:MAG: biopolymer transporter ExbD [Planctomycetes bacterium]|nr:biopolymer transporter ExbD [Planctomycetota bacterium]
MRTSRQRSRTASGVNLTPLMDAIFLVIVMLLSSFLHMRVVRAIRVERPVAAPASGVDGKRLLEVTVTKEGEIFVDGMKANVAGLAAALAPKADTVDACIISADRSALHGRVTEVLAAAKGALPETATYVEVTEEKPMTREGSVRK